MPDINLANAAHLVQLALLSRGYTAEHISALSEAVVEAMEEMDDKIDNIPSTKVLYGTEDLTPGVSELASGTLYVVYE